MPYQIAITGKGGVGKTTVAGLLVSRLIARGAAPVLAVDADPNTCLDEVLGVRAEATVGRVREAARQLDRQGIPKQQLLEMKIAESLVEADRFDLIAMGRSEGPGCYCYANNVLRGVLAKIAGQYPYVVIDNEAGLENLSRRIYRKVDLLAFVTEPSQRGLETVRRLHGLTAEMEIAHGRLALIVNRQRSKDVSKSVLALRDAIQADLLAVLPEDQALYALAERGAALSALPADNPVVRRLDEFLDQADIRNSARRD